VILNRFFAEGVAGLLTLCRYIWVVNLTRKWSNKSGKRGEWVHY